MLEIEPRILSADIQTLLAEIERLLPGHDPQALLVQNPSVWPTRKLLTSALLSSVISCHLLSSVLRKRAPC